MTTLAIILALTASAARCPTEAETERRHAKATAGLAGVDATLGAIDAALERAGVAVRPPPFTLNQHPIRLTAAQLLEYERTGRVRLYEFGWPLIDGELARHAKWAGGLLARVAAGTATQGHRDAAPADLGALQKERDRLVEAVDRTRFYVDRTRSWDGYCRRGPWLTDPSTKQQLEAEIAALERGGDAERLRAKRRVYDHYYEVEPNREHVTLERDERGYRMTVRLALGGPGADEPIRRRIADAVERHWRGSVDGVRFATVADVVLAQGRRLPRRHAIEIARRGEVFMASEHRFHAAIEPRTIAHEVGHVLGLPDRYRDLYDAERGLYVSYLENALSLMAAQNLEAAEIVEDDLRDLVRAYIGPKR